MPALPPNARIAQERWAEFLRLEALETDECVEWPYLNSHGYGRVSYQGRRHHAHRLALERATGISDPALVARHGPCHNQACMNTRHLSWGTVLDNQADRRRDGTHLQGSGHGASKLTEDDVRAIRSSADTQEELAARFSVTQTTISRVQRRECWAWLDNEMEVRKA